MRHFRVPRIAASQITDESVYRDRRRLLAAFAARIDHDAKSAIRARTATVFSG